MSLLKYLERKLLGRTPKTLSRASSIVSIEGMNRDLIEMILDDPNGSDQPSVRRRTMSQGSIGRSKGKNSSTHSPSLRKKTLNASFQKRSREENGNSPPSSPMSRSISIDSNSR